MTPEPTQEQREAAALIENQLHMMGKHDWRNAIGLIARAFAEREAALTARVAELERELAVERKVRHHEQMAVALRDGAPMFQELRRSAEAAEARAARLAEAARKAIDARGVCGNAIHLALVDLERALASESAEAAIRAAAKEGA